MYSLSETARMFGVSERTMHRWIREGHIPVYRLGRQLRFRKSDIEEFLEERREFPLLQTPLPDFSHEQHEYAESTYEAVAALMDIVAEEGERTLEEAKATPSAIPTGRPMRFFAARDYVSRSYEQLDRRGQVSEELREAKENLDGIASRLSGALHQTINPGSPEMHEQAEHWRRQRRRQTNPQDEPLDRRQPEAG
jgi:excisionase family DNA binding protein